MALTKRQKEVLDFLVAFETKHGYAPSFEEIGKGMKLTSLATVHKHITTLEKKGFIRRGYNQSRSIEILQLPKSVKDQIIERKVQELPLVGRIAAGSPAGRACGRARDASRSGGLRAAETSFASASEGHVHDRGPHHGWRFRSLRANAGGQSGRDCCGAWSAERKQLWKRFYREGPGKNSTATPPPGSGADHRSGRSDAKIQGRVIGVLRKY